MRECMVGAVAIRLKDPVFESQTKNKLGNTEIRSELVNHGARGIAAFFQSQQGQLPRKSSPRSRTPSNCARNCRRSKNSRANGPRPSPSAFRSSRIARVHFDKEKDKGKGSMVFITEGQSAAGSIVSCRDVNTQAIFVLKGKPLNVWDLKRDIVYKNDEMYNLMRSLDIEDNLEGLRYEKVILATDADVDGLHIRNLLITYFFRFFEQLVHDGHLYVLETPLFRVRNKEKTIYCYSEAERDEAVDRTGRKAARSRGSRAWAKFQPQGIQAIHRQGNAPEPGGIRAASRDRPASSAFTWARTPPSGRITSWKVWWCRWRIDLETIYQATCSKTQKNLPTNRNCPSEGAATSAGKPKPNRPNQRQWTRDHVLAENGRAVAHQPFDPGKIELAAAHARGPQLSRIRQLCHPRPRDSESGDGLKPVQRRILWALHEKDDGRFIKVANVVGAHDAISSARRRFHRRRAGGAGQQTLSDRGPGEFRQHFHRRLPPPRRVTSNAG